MLSKFLFLALCCATPILSSVIPTSTVDVPTTSLDVYEHEKRDYPSPLVLPCVVSGSPPVFDGTQVSGTADCSDPTVPNGPALFTDCGDLCYTLASSNPGTSQINAQQSLTYTHGSCKFQIVNTNQCNSVTVDFTQHVINLCTAMRARCMPLALLGRNSFLNNSDVDFAYGGSLGFSLGALDN